MPWELYSLLYSSLYCPASRHSMETHSLILTYFLSVFCVCIFVHKYNIPNTTKCHKLPALKCLQTVDVPLPTFLMKARESPMNKWFNVAAHKYVKLAQSKSGCFPSYTTAPHGRKKHSVLKSQKEIKLNNDWNGLSKCICSQNNIL